MTGHLRQLEALCRDPRLQVRPEQRAKIVENIIHSTMHPYFLRKSPEEQEQFRPHYLHHMQMLADYCLREYIESPEPRLTIEVVKGLHRVLYHNSASVPVKAMNGSMIDMVPGEFKTTPVFVRKPSAPDEWYGSTAPAQVAGEMAALLENLHAGHVPLFERYPRFMIGLTLIHPFADSNGKLAFLLGDLFLLRQGILSPYFARFRWENEADYYRLVEQYRLDPQREIAAFYPPLLRLYESCGLTAPQPAPAPGLEEQVFAALLEETAFALEGGDLPVGAALTVGETLLARHHNTIFSSGGLRFHAERNLLATLAPSDLPPGRRVLWVTLEPCMRCAQAIERFGVDEVVYALDDPFGGGRSVLARAGITLSRRPEWEAETLRLVMDSFTRWPERCAWKQYPFYLGLWRRHAHLGREEEVRLLFRHHLAPYLDQALRGQGREQQALLRDQFHREVEALARLSLREYDGKAPSVAFVRALHRALFPPGHRHRVVDNDGVATETASGEWRRHVHWPMYRRQFTSTEHIEEALTGLLAKMAAPGACTREAALQFALDFATIHPFTDGNGRLAVILADLLCVGQGLAPVSLDHKNPLLQTALLESACVDNQPPGALLALVDGHNQGRVGIRPRTIYDERPTAFRTYCDRSGNKSQVVEQILAKLAQRPPGQPLVITDIGAGTGAVADGLLPWLLEQGIPFEYHFLEPCPASVEYFRAHSPHASLPQVRVHQLRLDEFLPPPSDLLIAVQAMQYLPNQREALHDMLLARKPGGMALVVNTHPDSDDFLVTRRLGPVSLNYASLKGFLETERADYEEAVVVSPVRISPADRDTPAGDDLLAFYFHKPLAALTPAVRETFWAAVAEFARDGRLWRREAFFWITGGQRGGGGDDLRGDHRGQSAAPLSPPAWGQAGTGTRPPQGGFS